MKEKALCKILVVDDEESIVEILKYNLQMHNYDVRTAINGDRALEEAIEFCPDLILLDIMMPGMNGIDTCRLLRTYPSLDDTHVVFLTACAEEQSEITALDVGGSDYITKPIKPKVLMSRIKALLRRSNKNSSPIIKIGDLSIDSTSYTVCIGKREIYLPRKEFELLSFLAESPNKVFRRSDLLKNIWGSDIFVLERTVDVHIRKIREKIGNDYIITVKGVGYKFCRI